MGSTGACYGGSCSLICNSGYSLCSGRCVDTATDKQNCGACGNGCMGNRACVAGVCAKN
jgi:hypothetical protein